MFPRPLALPFSLDLVFEVGLRGGETPETWTCWLQEHGLVYPVGQEGEGTDVVPAPLQAAV